MIRTILNDIKKEDISHMQCHEHILLEKGASFDISDVLLLDDKEASLKELCDYKKAGGDLIVDAQPGYFGRVAEDLADISEKSGVHTIASTGFHKMIFCDEPSFFEEKTADELACFFADEILSGMISSRSKGYKKLGYKAGIIKTAVDKGGIYDGIYEKLFSAAAKAHKKTGAPILCHIENGADALEVIDFLFKNGVDAKSIIICHLDRAKYDFEYHVKTAKTGVFLDYDTVNRLKYLSHSEEISLIKYMCENGFAQNLLLSLDTTRARLKNYGSDMSLSYIIECFEDMLFENGISRDDILKMTCLNARCALSMKK